MDKYWCHYFICWVNSKFVMFGMLPAESAGEDWSPCPTFCLITAPRQLFLFLLMSDEQDIVSALLLSFLIMPSNLCCILLVEVQVGICRSCLKMQTQDCCLVNMQLACVESHICA